MDTSLILWGAFGGLLPDIIRLVKNRFTGEFAEFYRSTAYWTGLILSSFLGGLVVFLLKPQDIIYALSLGYFAPKIITSILSHHVPASAKQELTESDQGKIKIWHWWSV